MALSGVRSSCDSVARNSSLTRTASSATRTACSASARARRASSASVCAPSMSRELSRTSAALAAMASISVTSAGEYLAAVEPPKRQCAEDAPVAHERAQHAAAGAEALEQFRGDQALQALILRHRHVLGHHRARVFQELDIVRVLDAEIHLFGERTEVGQGFRVAVVIRHALELISLGHADDAGIADDVRGPGGDGGGGIGEAGVSDAECGDLPPGARDGVRHSCGR